MIQRVTFGDFVDAFRSMERNNFSFEGMHALFDYMEALEDDIGEPVELDVVGLCCDWTEFATWTEFTENYSDIANREELERFTTVIPLDASEGFIIEAF